MTNDLYTPKERLLRKLRGESADRAPVICPGGMLNSAIVEVMEHTGHVLPDGHTDAELMALLAKDIAELTGFENYGVPFCMTVEAEALGSIIDLGSLVCEPKINKERFASVSEALIELPETAGDNPRVAVTASAIHMLSGGDMPVIGSITGPISTAASLVDPMTFLKELRKDKDNAHKVLTAITDWLISYALVLRESGADIICIADPTATGEILGPRFFEEYAVTYINKLADGIRATGTPVIVHICGQLSSVSQHVSEIKSDAISTDAMVNLRNLKSKYPELTTMGNLSTIRLEQGNPEGVIRNTDILLRYGIDILAPACGLGTATPLKNIAAFTQRAKLGIGS
ncbi:MAG: methylcobamide--CoM methyltransferase [Oscillospiraceae bacterium]|nr:methylcobamide--CoM methyltransferase [Oscillospiraceae bacterium]